MNWPVNPLRGNQTKPLTGEPCAGNPPARFGGGRGRNQSVLPTPIATAEVPITAPDSRLRSRLPLNDVRNATFLAMKMQGLQPREARGKPRRYVGRLDGPT